MAQTVAIDHRRGARGPKPPLPVGVIGTGATLVTGGVLMINDMPWQGAAACVVPPVAVIGFTRWRSANRRQLREDLIEGVTALAGAVADVKCSQWAPREYRDPRPGRVEIRYTAGARDWDQAWIKQLLATVAARVGCEYEIQRHQSERERIVLVPTVDVIEEVDESPQSVLTGKADAVIGELLGKQSQAEYSWTDDDSLNGIQVTFPSDVAVKLVSRMKRQSVERVVTGTLPGRWRSSWDVENSVASFQLRTEFPDMVPHPAIDVTDENLYRIPSAVTEDGDDIVWNLRSTDPHGLTTGRTGTGKTVVLLGTCMEIAGRHWAVWVGDPKRVEFLGIRKWPNVQIVATTVEDQMAMIWDAFELMERRYRLIEKSGADEDDFEPILVLLDEYTEFRSAVNAWWAENKHKGAPSKCPIFNAVGSLARLARKARIHLRFGMQRPDAELLTGEVRDNLGDRHSLGRLSPNGAQMMWEAAFIGTSVPRSIPGRGTAVGPDGQPVEAQAYWTPDPRKVARSRNEGDVAILEGLYPARTTHKRFTYEIEDEEATTWLDEKGKPTLYTPWAAVTQARRVPSSDADEHFALEELLDDLSRARKTAAGEATPQPPEPRDDRHLRLLREDDDAISDDYGLVQAVCADRLRPGDLMNVDEDWVVVEEAVSDPEEEGMILVAWRSDDDDAGELALNANEMLDVRRMTEEED